MSQSVAMALSGHKTASIYRRYRISGRGDLSLAKTSSRSQVVDLSAPSGHNRGS